MAPILPLSVTDCLSLARVSRFGRWGTWKDKWCGDGSEVEEEEEERSAREESSSEGESSEGESSSESRALRLWKRNATKHCREVAMELIGSWPGLARMHVSLVSLEAGSNVDCASLRCLASPRVGCLVSSSA